MHDVGVRHRCGARTLPAAVEEVEADSCAAVQSDRLVPEEGDFAQIDLAHTRVSVAGTTVHDVNAWDVSHGADLRGSKSACFRRRTGLWNRGSRHRIGYF